VAETGVVALRREPRERREEHGRHGDREHPLRQHVEAERRIDRARRLVPVDQPRREDRVDEGVEVDQAEADRDRDHQHERLPHCGVAPVDHHLQPAVAIPQPRHGQQELDQRRDDDRDGVDIELRVARRLRDAEDEAEDDREIPEHGRQRRHAEVLVAVQDPDDDPREAEQDDDREEHAREPDGEPPLRAGVAEEGHDPRREQDEQRRQTAETEEHQPKQRRGDAPGALALALDEQLAEDRDERRAERRVRDERADGVRDEERDLERVDRTDGAEVVARHGLAGEAEHA
jgi:hypothetical protein